MSARRITADEDKVKRHIPRKSSWWPVADYATHPAAGMFSLRCHRPGRRSNAPPSFCQANTGNFDGPLISVSVEAAHRKGSDKYVYELTQREEQEEVSALGDFFREGEGMLDDDASSTRWQTIEDTSTCSLVRIFVFAILMVGKRSRVSLD